MSRSFNGGLALDKITFSVPNAPATQAGITIATLVKASSANFTGWILNGHDTPGFAKWSQLAAATGVARMFMENDFGSGGPAVGTGWCWMVSTKAAGTVPPEHYRYDFATDTWDHATGTANIADTNGAATTIILGNHTGGGAGDGWRGLAAAASVWKRPLTLTEIQAACTHAAWDLAAATPAWGILLNQTDVSTFVPDFTGNSGDQTAISGTAVSSDEPDGWSYSLTPPPSGPTISVWNGTVEVPATLKVWNGAAEVAATLSIV